MSEFDLRARLLDALYEVAPDLALHELDDKASLQRVYDLDSADFLSFLIKIHERFGIEIPTDAYHSFTTIGDGLAYLQSHGIR